MFYAEKAAENGAAIPFHRSLDVATELCRSLFHVDIRQTSIEKYYNKIKQRAAESHINWDHNTLAQIISTQVKTEREYKEVVNFVYVERWVSLNSSSFMFAVYIR